jgi:hypothetical protein
MCYSTLRLLACFYSLALTLRASLWLLLQLVVAPCMALAREIVNRLLGPFIKGTDEGAIMPALPGARTGGPSGLCEDIG